MRTSGFPYLFPMLLLSVLFFATPLALLFAYSFADGTGRVPRELRTIPRRSASTSASSSNTARLGFETVARARPVLGIPIALLYWHSGPRATAGPDLPDAHPDADQQRRAHLRLDRHPRPAGSDQRGPDGARPRGRADQPDVHGARPRPGHDADRPSADRAAAHRDPVAAAAPAHRGGARSPAPVPGGSW